MSVILDFYDVYNYETYINGFLDLEYPIFSKTSQSLVDSRPSLTPPREKVAGGLYMATALRT